MSPPVGPLAVVFVGPSIKTLLRPPPGVALWPPAGRGDLLKASGAGARIIGLIDGLVYGALPPSPGEVRQVAARGVLLIGGASLGALRAVECPQSMIGIGEIYERFKRGDLTDDDEVVGTYDPDTGQDVAIPLVVIREAPARTLDPSTCEAFCATLKAMPFHDPTLAALDHATGRPGQRVAAALRDGSPSVKTRDALAVCKRVLVATESLGQAES